MFLSLFVLARGALKFLFRLKLDSQLLRGGKSSCSLWSELQVMESKNLVVIDCLRRESVSKLAWCNASLYGTNGKIIRMALFCSCSSSADEYAIFISKEHNNFSYLWKSEADIPNSFVFATQQFCSFWWLLFYNDNYNNNYYYYYLFVIACKALHKFLK